MLAKVGVTSPPEMPIGILSVVVVGERGAFPDKATETVWGVLWTVGVPESAVFVSVWKSVSQTFPQTT